MKSFVVTVEELLKVNTNKKEEFNSNKRCLCIPKYQREYTWEDDTITTFISDISSTDKFLGNLMLDESEDCYEIVDGQQRITTCILILMAIFNKYNGQPMEQKVIRNLIINPDTGKFYLKNDSIGNYIIENNGKVEISIEPNKDIYYQAEDFNRAFELVTNLVNNIQDLSEFRRKILSCELLVLINDEQGRKQSVEQIFLDINDKAKLLTDEDKFKGYCFKNYDSSFYNELRDKWSKLKHVIIRFKSFGFKKTNKYIYTYLLLSDSKKLQQNLKIKGKHYLEGKSMDETDKILSDLIGFGETVLTFYDNICKTEYIFNDICSDSKHYVNNSNYISILKYISNKILTYDTVAVYQKLAFMSFIYQIKINSDRIPIVPFTNFRKIIVNLYVYSILFTLSPNKKSKDDIDHSIRDAMSGETPLVSAEEAAIALRKERVKNFTLPISGNFNTLSFIYSVIDYYNSNNSWFDDLYTKEKSDTLEHFLIPDNRNCEINWIDGERRERIVFSDIYKSEKTKTINLLVLNDVLNGDLEDFDIVTKIDKIKKWYTGRNENIPKHVKLYISRIESMDEYLALKNIKGNAYTFEDLRSMYYKFLSRYFQNPDFAKGTESLVESEFKTSFQN